MERLLSVFQFLTTSTLGHDNMSRPRQRLTTFTKKVRNIASTIRLADPLPSTKQACPFPRDATTPRQKPKLLDHLREALRSRHYNCRTQQTYCQWVKRFIYFHNLRHPKEMAEPEINAFLTHLAVKEKVSASTKPGAFRPAFSISSRHRSRSRRPGRRDPGPQTQTPASRHDPRGSQGRAGKPLWR